jgi:hypothetical protein
MSLPGCQDYTVDDALPVQIVDTAVDLVKRGLPLEAVHREVVRVGSSAMPSPCWQAIADVDTRRDVSDLAGWLTEQVCSPAAPDELSAVWLGLHEEYSAAAGGCEAAMELTGGCGYPRDEQWLFHLDWRPGPVPAPGLGELLPLAASGPEEMRDLVAYAVVLGYAMALSADAIEAAGVNILLDARPMLTAVATGFCDGDIALIGTMGNGRLDRSAISWI